MILLEANQSTKIDVPLIAAKRGFAKLTNFLFQDLNGKSYGIEPIPSLVVE